MFVILKKLVKERHRKENSCCLLWQASGISMDRLVKNPSMEDFITLDYIFSDKMAFLSEEHLFKTIQQKHASLSFQTPLFKFHKPESTSFIHSVYIYLLPLVCVRHSTSCNALLKHCCL